MNQLLRLKIVEKFMTNGKFASAAGIHESTLSKIILGSRKPTESQKAIISSLLRMKKEDLFPGTIGDVRPEVVAVRRTQKENGKNKVAA
jgi:predicted transcriptional regulator